MWWRAVVAVLFAPPILGALVANEMVVTSMDHLPAGPTTVLVSGTGERYGPEAAALLLGALAVGALAVGIIARHRRDPDRKAPYSREVVGIGR